jgi:hypothetical protein
MSHPGFLRKSAWPASRSEALMVVAGFSPRELFQMLPRREAAPEDRGRARSTNRSTLQWRYVQDFQSAARFQPVATGPTDTVAVLDCGCAQRNNRSVCGPAAASPAYVTTILYGHTTAPDIVPIQPSLRDARCAGPHPWAEAHGYHRVSLCDSEGSAVAWLWLRLLFALTTNETAHIASRADVRRNAHIRR